MSCMLPCIALCSYSTSGTFFIFGAEVCQFHLVSLWAPLRRAHV